MLQTFVFKSLLTKRNLMHQTLAPNYLVEYSASIFLIWPFLEAREEIEKYFHSFFEGIEKKKTKFNFGSMHCVYAVVGLRVHWTNTVKQKICEDWICFLAQGQHSFLFIFMCSTPITSVNDDAWPDNNSFACFMATLT